MREFCDEDGAEMLAWARNLLYNTPDFVMVGNNKVVNLVMSRSRPVVPRTTEVTDGLSKPVDPGQVRRALTAGR
jgi:hypothetical protein